MRTLERNKSDIWTRVTNGFVDEMIDGLYTGVEIPSFGEVTKKSVNMYPSNGTIINEIFGVNVNADMVIVSNDVILTHDTEIYLSEPTEESKVDYKVVRISKSLNTYQYALEKVI